jgi:hypothetical protein
VFVLLPGNSSIASGTLSSAMPAPFTPLTISYAGSLGQNAHITLWQSGRSWPRIGAYGVRDGG